MSGPRWPRAMAALLMLAGGTPGRAYVFRLFDLDRHGSTLEWTVGALFGGFLGGVLGGLIGSRAVPHRRLFAARQGRGRMGSRFARILRLGRIALYGAAAVATSLALVSCGSTTAYATVGTEDIPFAMMVTGLVGVAAGVLVAVRFRPWTRAVRRSPDGALLECAVGLLPLSSRQRWLEEWRTELGEINSTRGRIRFSLSLLRGMPLMRIALRSPFSRRGEG